MYMPIAPSFNPERVLPCQRCQEFTPARHLIVLGGRRLCLRCTGAALDGDDDNDHLEHSVRQPLAFHLP